MGYKNLMCEKLRGLGDVKFGAPRPLTTYTPPVSDRADTRLSNSRGKVNIIHICQIFSPRKLRRGRPSTVSLSSSSSTRSTP